MSNESEKQYDEMSWPDAVRELIKHENDLIAQRVGWMGTLEGFLFAALSFSWQDPGRGLHSPVLILCPIGILVAAFSIWGIWLADDAIHTMLKELDKKSYVFGYHPPVWGPVCETVRNKWKVPWIWLPIIIIMTWCGVLFMHFERSDPRLKGEWPNIVQKYMQAVFEHQSEAEAALKRLAGMPGDPARGETIFKERGCSGCHLHLLPKDGAPSVETLQSYHDRVRIVRGILNPTGELPAHRKPMPNGILSTMSSEEFLDVVEYLNSPPP